MERLFRICVLVFMLLASSCGNLENEDSTSTVVSATSTNVQSTILNPTETPIYQTATPISAESELASYIQKYADTRCVSTSSPTLPYIDIAGSLLISRQDENRFNYLSLLNFATGEEKDLLNEQDHADYGINISLDGKWVAYRSWRKGDTTTQSWLSIISVDGKSEKVVPWPDKWAIILNWLDNDKLLIKHSGDLNLSTFNPFTQIEQNIETEFPDRSSVSPLNAAYSPSLSKVVYPTLEQGGIRLFDLLNGKKIIDIIPAMQEEPPKWSPDGKTFVVSNLTNWTSASASDYNLFLVSEDGIIKRLTNFSDSPSYMTLEDYSWSPDGKFIAFWIMINETFGYLNIVNVNTGEIADTCISSDLGPETNAPVWSPDGNQLAFRVFNNGNGKLIVINWVENIAFQTEKNYRPIGWAASQ